MLYVLWYRRTIVTKSETIRRKDFVKSIYKIFTLLNAPPHPFMSRRPRRNSFIFLRP